MAAGRVNVSVSSQADTERADLASGEDRARQLLLDDDRA
jgi:hypothetical protein